MLILNASDVKKALPMRAAIEATKSAYAALSQGKAEVPLRARLNIAPHDASALFMPAFLQSESGEALAVKIVTLHPGNPAAGLPFIHAAVVVMNPATGQIEAVLEGGALTAIRTGAAGGAATDILARPDSRTLAIFGAGAQARTQLLAACTVREIETVYVYDSDASRIAAFIAEMAGQGPIPTDLRAAESPEQAVLAADIISAATTTRTPLFDPLAVRPGTHINGVGSYTRDMIEIPPEIVATAAVFVDSKPAIMEEAGEILAAINRKLFFPAEMTELGEVVAGTAPGRMSLDQVTFFKSVGVAVQDAMAAQLALKNAREMGLGQEVAW